MKRMTIGRIAELAGVGVETIRYYERCGLIERPPRPVHGGYRLYSEETVDRVRLIRQARELGFSLREIAALLSLRADPGADCAEVRERARTRLDAIDREIAHLRRMRSVLERLIAACPGRGDLGRCAIMGALDPAHRNADRRA